MIKKYKAKKGKFIIYLILFLCFSVLGSYLSLEEKNFIFILFILPTVLFIWIYLDTSYAIENDKLLYRSAFLRGKININDINEISVGKTMWSGLKPALAKNGLIIRYKYNNEIYFAPESNSELISDLLKINAEIKIIR